MELRQLDAAGVRVMENEWIEMSDGCRLAARIWLPSSAAPVPAVLEYLPYRKDDRTALQDSTRHPYFALNGYAAVRVDLRGTGDSDGVLRDEYLQQEQDDALEVIEWIARQAWCSGDVGMIGYSWGGFNGLQVAARRPPALGAVVSLHSTDDRYADDCHYLGGCVLAADMLRWAETMRAINALPPTPEVVGDGWAQAWQERLKATPHFVEAWLSHQRRDEYWRHASIAEDYSAIEVPVLVVGGWADGYTNAVPRILEHLCCPRAGIIGPWAHAFPEHARPGPRIGFLQECVTWFDRWLKGAANGVEGWPLLRAWLQEPAPPAAEYAERPGRWVQIDRWPPDEVAEKRLGLAPGRLLSGDQQPERAPVGDVRIATVQSLGETAGVWCANGLPDELALDQSADDERSACFDSEPLAARLELLGVPRVELELSSDQPQAAIVARLCDVAEDGTSVLLSFGALNLTHRESHAEPEALEPGRRYRVEVPMNVLGQAVEAGHRLRLALSTTYWPMLWPLPFEATLTLATGPSSLVLPIVERPPVIVEHPFGLPEASRQRPSTAERRRKRWTERDGARRVTAERELAEVRLEDEGIRIREEAHARWSIADDDPLSAEFSCHRDYLLARERWTVRVSCDGGMTADSEQYHVTEIISVFLGEEMVYSHEGAFDIARDFT